MAAEPLIDLGADRGAPQVDRPRRRPPVRRWRRAAAALLACAALGGAAPVTGLPVAAGPAVPARGALLVAGTLLLVVDPTTAPPTMSAYDAAAPGRPARWQVPVPEAAGWSAEAVGDLLLIAERDATRQVVGTTARSARTGEVRWRRQDRVYAASDGAVAVFEVRSVTAPGRRVEGAVRGVDLATGRTRWSVRIPSTAVMEVLPGAAGRVLVVHDNGDARLHDARAGALLGGGRLPPADYAPDNPQVIGEHLVLRHPTTGGTVLAGYSLPGLALRWRLPVGPDEMTVRGCEDLVCLHDRQGRRAVRPDTGAPAWTWPDGATWRAVPAGSPAPGPAVLLRPGADGERSLVATAGRGGVRVLGVLPAGAGDCRAVPAGLVCRTGDGRLAVWSLRPVGAA